MIFVLQRLVCVCVSVNTIMSCVVSPLVIMGKQLNLDIKNFINSCVKEI